MTSVLTKKQTKTFRADYTDKGQPQTLIAKVRHDDECSNGHNTFSITADLYTPQPQRGEPTIQHESGKVLWLNACGCLHDDIARRIPELAPLIKWHLTSTDEPMHYIANTVYMAGDKDYNGLREGETRQIRNGKTGVLCWKLQDPPEAYIDADEQPAPVTLQYEPLCHVGEGKKRELDHARSSAVWPDATDEDLTAPGLKERLEARLPGLMVEFQAAVESLGFTY